MKLTIRAKLVGLALLVGLMISGPLAVYTLVVERNTQIEEVENKGMAAASLLAETLIDPLYQLRIDQIDRLLGAARSNPELVGVYVLDRDGLILSDGGNDSSLLDQRLPGLDPILAQIRRSPRAVSQREDGAIAVTGPVRSPDGAILGFVHLRLSLRHAEEKIAAEWRVLAALGGAVYLLGGLLALVLARQFTRPLREVMDATQSIRRGDFSIRIPVGRQDEFGALAQAINEMAEDLQGKTISKRHLDNIIRSMADSLIVTDAQGRIEIVNPSALALLGYQPEQLLGQPVGQILHEGIELAAGHLFSHRETRYRTSMGDLVPVSLSLAALTDEAGRLSGFVLAAQDITERKEYEEELQRSNIDLEQFSYAVSHDMRQPLRMISSYLQLLERSLADQLDGEKRGYFDIAIDGAKRIDQMLVDLLEYSRVGRMGESPMLIESRAVLDEALQFLQPALGEAQAKLNISGDWPRILVSHDEILGLIQNLIGNAIKYRIAGRIPEITVISEADKNEWRLCVADNGIGIIPDQIKRLFHVFQRLQTRTDYEGTGIGLALCRKIAEHHKGRIWAESAGEGQGSRFCVVLPVLRRDTMSAKGEPTGKSA